MLVRNNALLFSVNNPAPVLDALPKAKLLRIKGRDIIAVRHSLDSARVLNNLGLNAPSPVLTDYEFTGRYTPLKKQKATVNFFTLNKRAYCFNQMRTGKTGAALWALDYLKNVGEINRVLVVCPINAMDVWVREAFAVAPHRTVIQLLGSQAKKLQLAEQYADINIIGFDGLSTLFHEEFYEGTNKVKRRWHDLENKYDLIIFDEAHAYCNAQNLRWKAAKQLIKVDTWVWELTGTPTNNAPTDSYGLIKLMQPEKIPASYKLFEEHLMRPVGPYKKVPRAGAKEYVYGLMQPAVRMLRDDDESLPTTIQDVPCRMSKEQEAAFADMKERMYYESDGSEITAANAAVRLIKLQQIMCGAVKDADGNALELGPKDRLEKVLDLVQGAEAKTVVFVPFIHTMHMISNYLEQKGITTAILNGTLSKAKRDEIVKEFRFSKDPHVLIAHPKVASLGYDFTVADTFIWYAPIFSNEQYEQANARGEGINKTKPVGIYHIGCHPVEWRIYDVLDKKSSMQNSILDLYNSVF